MIKITDKRTKKIKKKGPKDVKIYVRKAFQGKKEVAKAPVEVCIH